MHPDFDRDGQAVLESWVSKPHVFGIGCREPDLDARCERFQLSPFRSETFAVEDEGAA